MNANPTYSSGFPSAASAYAGVRTSAIVATTARKLQTTISTAICQSGMYGYGTSSSSCPDIDRNASHVTERPD